tara:strand:+ start:372 stop:1700 length:1329 start_codon:yes stop_codon:yes gene_type:complete
MASLFTTSDKVKIPGLFSPTAVPFYLQFVPGYVTDVVTSDKSLYGYNRAEFVNSIIALPHVYKGAKKRRANVDASRDRYFPLMRGMVDVPAKGDPVLLCKIGPHQYYLGPLNTANSPNFNEDILIKPEYPYTTEEDYEPTAEEKLTAKGQSINFKKVRTNRVNKRPNPTLDEFVEGKSAINETHGDMMFEGRHGNSLRIGSRSKNPYIFISNGRYSKNHYESLADGTIISITSRGSLSQHFGSYDRIVSKPNPDDVSTWNIEKINGFQFASDLAEGNQRHIAMVVKSINQVDDINPLLYDYGQSPRQNQVLIHSDRIIFNSKGPQGDIYLSSRNNIHIGAGNHMSISTGKNLIIESDKVSIGDPNKETNKGKMEPMVLGNALVEVIDELFKILEGTTSNQYFPLALGYLGQPLTNALTPLRTKLEAVKSQYHEIEPNGRETQ